MRRSRTSRLGRWVLLVALGAGGMYAYQSYFGSSDGALPTTTPPASWYTGVGIGSDNLAAAPENEAANDTASDVEGVSGSERIGDEDDAGVVLDRPGSEVAVGSVEGVAVAPVSAEEIATPTPAVVVLGVEELPAALQPGEAAAEGNPLVGAPVGDFQEAYKNAKKAFADGDTPRAFELYRMIFFAAKDRGSEIDTSVIAQKLLDATSDEQEKLEYYKYLAQRNGGVAGQFHAQLAAAQALAKDRNPKNARPAWRALTNAYLAAATREERVAALDLLQPFLKRHIFSARPSPLLTSYRVKRGDYLASVAKAHKTTIDAIKRLNHLSKETIQAGKRLLVLPGPTSVLVKKTEFCLAVFSDGNLLFERPIGTGADSSTPEGTFFVSERQKNPIWYRPGEAPILPDDPRNILGSRWLGFRDTSSAEGIGIHGTSDESSIGKELSLGCVRLRNADVELVYDFVRNGAEVVIEY